MPSFFNRLSAENLEQAWQAAHASKHEKLLQACSEFVVDNLHNLATTDFVAKMKEEDFERLLKSAKNQGMEERAAFTTLVSWIKASPDRSEAFGRLVPIIDCSELSADFVAKFYGKETELLSIAANR